MHTIIDLAANKIVYNEDSSYITFVNVNDGNIYKIDDILRSCRFVEDITFQGELSHLNIPDGAYYVTCSSMGLKSIFVPDNIKFLICNSNQLETLEVPCGIEGVICENNKISNIRFRGGDPYSLRCLIFCNNNISKFDAKLPNTLYQLYCANNFGLRFRYLDSILKNDAELIMGDIDQAIFAGKLKDNENLRWKLYEMCQDGHEYVALKDLLK